MAHRAMAIPQDAQADVIGQAISDLTIEAPAIQAIWPGLDGLSSRTVLEALEAAPGGIVTDGHQFEASATIYVTLNYGESNDDLSMSDSYPVLIRGHLDEGGAASVDDVDVDTASFYGASEEA